MCSGAANATHRAAASATVIRDVVHFCVMLFAIMLVSVPRVAAAPQRPIQRACNASMLAAL